MNMSDGDSRLCTCMTTTCSACFVYHTRAHTIYHLYEMLYLVSPAVVEGERMAAVCPT